jgi:hypothetical protein
MSLADQRKTGPRKKQRPCLIRTVIETLPPEEADALREMLNDADWNSADISRALADENINVSRERIRVHRQDREEA